MENEKNHVCGIYLTQSQYDLLQKRANAAGLKISTALRLIILNFLKGNYDIFDIFSGEMGK